MLASLYTDRENALAGSEFSGPGHGCVLAASIPGTGLLAENAHLGLVAFLAVHIHGQVFEVIDEFIEIFRFDL